MTADATGAPAAIGTAASGGTEVPAAGSRRGAEPATGSDRGAEPATGSDRGAERAVGSDGRLARFDRVERAVHWVNAVLILVLVFTGAALYLEPLGQAVGRRALVQDIHVYCGLALPVPLVLALAGPWGRALRADLRRFNRWSRSDRLWLRALFSERGQRRALRSQLPMGKFNAGQKLNAAWTAGVALVLLATGIVMRWYHPWPLSWRTGATFVHDWSALAVGVVVVGHVFMALADRDALVSMFTGRISREWAARHARAWLDEKD
ncbi:MAG: cytochrome b/b6 domain-containing protein [Acidobacteriota bacterium]|nr:cytochrome b/b6 domain-containing protein [Acidobacteriota bacterium]